MNHQVKRQSYTRAIHQPLTVYKNPNRQTPRSLILPSKVSLEFENGKKLSLALQGSILLGRKPQDMEYSTCVNLSQVGGDEKGVSRSHAILSLMEGTLFVRDCNSSNGTYLNHAELYPMRNYVVNDGDWLMLGRLKMRITFVL